MMNVTRDVILDLLPLYLADEVSADTRALVEAYLETDPELARRTRESAALFLSDDVPIPLQKEDEMEAYQKTKRLIITGAAIAAVVIASGLGLALLAMFVLSS